MGILLLFAEVWEGDVVAAEVCWVGLWSRSVVCVLLGSSARNAFTYYLQRRPYLLLISVSVTAREHGAKPVAQSFVQAIAGLHGRRFRSGDEVRMDEMWQSRS